MQPILPFRLTILATLLAGASLMLAIPAASAAPNNIAQQTATRHATGEALAAARRDFSQFVVHQLQRQGARSTSRSTLPTCRT